MSSIWDRKRCSDFCYLEKAADVFDWHTDFTTLIDLLGCICQLPGWFLLSYDCENKGVFSVFMLCLGTVLQHPISSGWQYARPADTCPYSDISLRAILKPWQTYPHFISAASVKGDYALRNLASAVSAEEAGSQTQWGFEFVEQFPEAGCSQLERLQPNARAISSFCAADYLRSPWQSILSTLLH